METGTVFINNRTQAVRLPASTRFPDSVKRVQVRIVGKDRVLTPVESAWDSFFLNGIEATEDFLTERADQAQKEREQL
ncbi:MAG: AbrB/MazE/SpoVT family DNA-binding domain-containing protein [Deltaproteobacteria bacterium]|nr:AbrB/MazE/SpoVT family DNA-binding domain-containing protein [Deltaproteobacteria bacterium]